MEQFRVLSREGATTSQGKVQPSVNPSSPRFPEHPVLTLDDREDKRERF